MSVVAQVLVVGVDLMPVLLVVVRVGVAVRLLLVVAAIRFIAVVVAGVLVVTSRWIVV